MQARIASCRNSKCPTDSRTSRKLDNSFYSTVVLGEMSVQGLLLRVTSLPERMQLAVEAGAKRILIPSENKRDLAEVPDAILTSIQWQFYDSPTKAAILSMGMG